MPVDEAEEPNGGDACDEREDEQQQTEDEAGAHAVVREAAVDLRDCRVVHQTGVVPVARCEANFPMPIGEDRAGLHESSARRRWLATSRTMSATEVTRNHRLRMVPYRTASTTKRLIAA